MASIEKMLKEGGIEVVQPGIGVKYVPDENELKSIYQFGKDFAGKVK